jgi:peptidoglycan LD-endopeptidase LytH
MRRFAAVIVVVAASYGWLNRNELRRWLPLAAVTGTAHERYAGAIRARGLDTTDLGRAWLEQASTALESPNDVRLPFHAAEEFDPLSPEAVAWRFTAQRGQRITVAVDFHSGEVFVDLFDADRHVLAASDPRSRELTHVAARDGPLVVRVQPELLRGGAVRVRQLARASLDFPVRGMTARAVQGIWGDARDAGRRRHEGIDIFAPRGTPAVAAVDGWITGTGQNRLGGNVVWLWSPAHRVALYYAHLDRQAVSRGERVSAGEVVGYVGTTGNARGASPHLHFGIYAQGEGAIDPYPWVVDPPKAASPGRNRGRGEQLMHRSRRTSVRDR